MVDLEKIIRFPGFTPFCSETHALKARQSSQLEFDKSMDCKFAFFGFVAKQTAFLFLFYLRMSRCKGL